MKSNSVYPSQEKLSPEQKLGLGIVSKLVSNQGREIVIAIDRTQSVKIEEEGRTRITQLIRDALQVGDRIYIIDFATDIDDAKLAKEPIIIRSNEDKTKLLDNLSFESDPNLRNTDIQNAEWKIYKRLAELNQERLIAKQPIYSQSVIWMTDAPLFTQSPATEQNWIETPLNSPFRDANSQQSKDRSAWLQSLDLLNKPERSHQIKDNYKLTVVDIAPTVQEVCTYAPSGQSNCLVAPYLVNQLWLPSFILGISSLAVLLGLIVSGLHIYASRKGWKISINDEHPNVKMKNRYNLGEYPFDCGDSEIRGYLLRRGKDLWLEASKNDTLKIFLDGQEIVQREKILKENFTLTLNCENSNPKEFLVRITK
ncbi:VWA domain-containing protein [Pseudanabaena sp. FACHB-1998]|uniref:VWA domain-containing protein n=1 Tax=Pseudanabaena sp. FACHB-1998 TaxID=2692858 RepID=UPI001680B2C5|nr:VWA domain-containing protein [Pseudanabaena sp. FACHB-1998]MBD2175673.1 VWA domain-containing protein [Pseudanabaena sp. FACHB-1998]